MKKTNSFLWIAVHCALVLIGAALVAQTIKTHQAAQTVIEHH